MGIIYQNYHRHSHRTNVLVPDSTVSNEEYAIRAVELGHGIISTMEHGNQGCYIEGHELSNKYGLRFVFGAEAYWVKDRTQPDGTNSHIYIGARNEHGRQCINDVLSEANLTGFYKRPRIDIPLLLSLPPKDVIVTSACVAFWKYDDIDSIVEQLAAHFGNSFYLEVQYHVTDSQRQLNQHILTLRDRLRLPIIMGCDSHYIHPQQAQDREDYLLSKNIRYEDEYGWFLDYPDGNTAFDRFREQGVLNASQIEEAMSNTNVFLDTEVYENEIFDSTLKLPSLPRMRDWTQAQKDEEYKRLVWQGWDRYKASIPEDKHSMYEQEIQYEISAVLECHMADYFLIDHDIIKRGKELGGLLTTTGRGSAVSFITNKLLGFTEVDRIAANVKMYPDRFMTATRILQANTLPDIDLNMADPSVFARAQQEVLGEDHAYPMISYHPMKTSSAWKLYAKSQNVPFEEANAVSDEIRRYEDAVKQADEDSKDDIDIMDFISERYQDIFLKSSGYRGITNSWSIAPCGYLLYNESIRRQIGLVRINDRICCIMDGHWAENGHFLKNDLLKVSVVTLINAVYRRIGMDVPTVNELIDMCPPGDPAWDIYAKGCNMGVNQVEKKGTAARCATYKPTNISELCAFVAAIRPGFKSMYSVFEARRPFEYGVKAFDELMKTEELPYAFCLYQEQEMAALHYAGIPMAECYTAIKDIAKKRAAKVLAYRERFVAGFTDAIVADEGCSTKQAEEIAHKLWQVIEDSARYSFNACVSGDTILRRPDKASWWNPTVEEMYMIRNFSVYAKATGHASLHRKYMALGYGNSVSMEPDGRIKRNAIVDIRPAGIRMVYEVRTESGETIKCTDNHKFPTPVGERILSDLHVGDALYIVGEYGRKALAKGVFAHTSRIESIREVGEERTYNIEMSAPCHNFVTGTGVVTSNSHSYCVSCDSLYIAWAKAHYPMELYETLLRFYDSRGEKDKITEAKAEARRFFGVRFPPMRFGQDNRTIVCDVKNRLITDSISTIKDFSASTGQLLWESSQVRHDTFMDLLLDLNSRGVKSKVLPLIRLDYFEGFGNQRELLKIHEIFTLFKNGEAKQMRRELIDDTPLEQPVRRHSTWLNKNGSEAKSYKLMDVHAILVECEAAVRSANMPDVDELTKIKHYTEIMGHGGYVSGKEEDRRKLFVKEVFPLKRKKDGKQFGYSVVTQSIGSGVEARFTLNNRNYALEPIKEGQVILCTDYVRQGQYFELTGYRRLF